MRSLRIGVVIAGQLVEERVFPGTRPISFGQSLRCALSVPVEGVPREHVLFARDDGAFVLHVAPGMTARVGIGDRIEAVTGAIRIASSARGKLVLGEVTLLFQDVATVVRPRPQLPAALRARPFDRRLALIIGASLFVHIGIAAWAWNADSEVSVLGMRDVPAEFRQDTIDVQLPDFVEPQTPTQTAPAVAPPVAPQHHIVEPVRSLPSDPDQLARDASRMASILTGDDGARGFGGMNHRQPGADLARQIDDAQHRTVTIGDNGHTSRVDDRARAGTGHDLELANPNAMIPAETDHHERAGTARIVLQPLPGEGERTTLTAQAVLDKIQAAYLPGLQRCYRLGQNEDASLEGKVRIELTVDEHGRVTDPGADGLTAKVDGCIQHFMATWHFGVPRDKAGEPTDATFKIALVLKTS